MPNCSPPGLNRFKAFKARDLFDNVFKSLREKLAQEEKQQKKFRVFLCLN